jgi:hypothetical protein
MQLLLSRVLYREPISGRTSGLRRRLNVSSSSQDGRGRLDDEAIVGCRVYLSNERAPFLRDVGEPSVEMATRCEEREFPDCVRAIPIGAFRKFWMALVRAD